MNESATEPELNRTPRRQLRPREKWLLAGMAVLAIFALLFGSEVSGRVTAWLVLRSEKPTPNTVIDLAAKLRNPAPFLERLWRTDRIPHRLLAMSFIKQHVQADPALFAQMEPMILEAVSDPYLQVRTWALETLEAERDARLLPLARAQLRDADSHGRLLGLTLLREQGSAKLVPLAIPLLDDPDPAVIVAAANTLRRWTGQDFGIRTAQAVQASNDISGKADLAGAQALVLGVRRWKEWWESHRSDYANQAGEPAESTALRRLPTEDRVLEDLAGKPVRLSDFKGKVVLVNFWDSETTPNMNDMSALSELQQRHPDRVVVLGISLETSLCERSCAFEHAGAAHHQVNLPELRNLLLARAKDKGINYRILIDRTGAVGRSFDDDELANNVLLDVDGFICRRFVGTRPVPVLEAMVEEAAKMDSVGR